MPEPSSTPLKTPTLAGFAALGLFWGAWAAVLPGVQHATGASKGALGLALLFVTVGSLPAMLLIAGPAVDRYGARAVALGCAAFAVATTLPGLATSLPVLALTLVVAGGASGALDVGINANAARIEADTGQRLMPLAHGLYSVGVLVGAVAAGVARSQGATREPILLAVSALLALTALLLGTDRAPGTGGHGQRRLHIERALLLIGIVAAAALVVEGGMESWSALYLERQLGAQPQISGLGPGVIGLSMALGRFYGQATHLSDRALLTGGAALAAAGCTIAALAPSSPIALVGFFAGGAGISVNAPITFGAAGRSRRDSASAVATVTTLGYVGLLVGPPLVGGVGQAVSLRGSFVVLAAVAA
ncbi:MAG: MFS transporter, partial [Gaiellaceae bacterium]